jgi:hypothetical protein
MRVLFDDGVPRGVASALGAHSVDEVRSCGWDKFQNGELLDAAESAGFNVLLTTDRNIRYQQNLTARKIAIVALSKGQWTLIRKSLPEIAAAVDAATPGSFTEVEIPIN